MNSRCFGTQEPAQQEQGAGDQGKVAVTVLHIVSVRTATQYSTVRYGTIISERNCTDGMFVTYNSNVRYTVPYLHDRVLW